MGGDFVRKSDFLAGSAGAYKRSAPAIFFGARSQDESWPEQDDAALKGANSKERPIRR